MVGMGTGFVGSCRGLHNVKRSNGRKLHHSLGNDIKIGTLSYQGVGLLI